MRRAGRGIIRGVVHIVSLGDLALSRRAAQFQGRDYGTTVSFFVTRHERGDGPGLHRHPYEETFIVQEGTAAFTVDGEKLAVEAGNVVVVPAGAAHAFERSGDGPLRMVSIHSAPEMVTEWLEEDRPPAR